MNDTQGEKSRSKRRLPIRGKSPISPAAHTVATLDRQYKRSRFCHLFSKAGVHCLYHSLSMKKLYGGEILSQLFRFFGASNKPGDFFRQSGSGGGISRPSFARLIDSLIAAKMLIQSGAEDDALLLQRQTEARSIREISLLYHLSTSKCNYNCGYCFIENKIPASKFMTQETSRKGIDYFAAQSRHSKVLKVIFYGGEPLLNKAVVYDAIEYIRHLESTGAFAKSVEITLLTNGSLVDSETVAVAKKHRIKTGVSIDGPGAIHDKTRRGANGKGTFTASVRGFRLLQQAGLQPSISCTLNQANIRHFDETLAFLLEELKPSGIGFNILMPQWGEPFTEDVAAATARVIQAFEKMRQLGIYEDRMMRRARPFCSDAFHYKDCFGVGGQIALTPDGRIGPCQAYLGMDAYYPVSVDKLPEDINEHPIFARWIERFPLNNSECLSCRALAICGGGCPYAAEAMTGSIDGIDRRVCQQCLPIMDWLIWDLYKQLNQRKEGTA
jgi:uncharacterized protein